MMNFINLQSKKYFWLLLGSIYLTTNLAAIAHALKETPNTQNSDRPTPSLYLAKNAKANEQINHREYTFKAPDSKVLSNTEQLTKIQGYKVEVYGNAQQLLQQVQDIAPNAFIKGELIQVGIFSNQDNAEDLVRKLAIAGFWARITVQ